MASRSLAPGSYIQMTPIRYPSPVNGRQSWAEQVRGSMMAPAPQQQISISDTLLGTSVAYGGGVALGLLDKFLPKGLENWDLATGLGLEFAAVLLNSPIALNLGHTCFGVSGYRSVDKLMALLSGETPAESTVSGESSTDEDPIVSQCKTILKNSSNHND